MTKAHFASCFLLLVSLLTLLETSAQRPAAQHHQRPANITAQSLEQGGLNRFAPTDNAFANLKSAQSTHLGDQQKRSACAVPYSPYFNDPHHNSKLLANPLRYFQAGNSNDGVEFPLNVHNLRGIK
ncbi:hypothetical protein CUMW_148630 [Citrus unshiu]|uniref:Uncharacterized protein n=1 Tax=Citrus unshiu TaxID=55188 RepID=A0A2H5PLX0_CITUN|nr:hypothetical protein CUMW_148630 [Citrus unshiu]